MMSRLEEGQEHRGRTPFSGAASGPLVSIGLPVRNGGTSLDNALRSLSNQTYPHFELLISDNDSDDETPAVCEQWVKRDARIRYVRQPRNIGPPHNFRFVLQHAAGPYFMWAAHDDWWDPEFIAANLAVLESRQDVVCSVPTVELADTDGVGVPSEIGTRELIGDCRQNLISYLTDPGANSRIYGLYRTAVLQKCFHETDTYWAFDWAIAARTLVWGKHHHLPRMLMRRSARGMSSDGMKWVASFNPTWLGRCFPMLPLTRQLLTDPQIPVSLGLIRVLGRWNATYLGYSVRRFRRTRVRPALERIGLRRRPSPAAS